MSKRRELFCIICKLGSMCVLLLNMLDPIAAVHAQEQSWETFQADPGRTGNAERPAIEKPEIRWKTQIGICGYLNNAVVADGKVWVGSSGNLHNRPDVRDGIWCLELATGKVLWHRQTPIDACGVLLAGDKILATCDDGALRALDAAGGKVLWELQREGELYAQPLRMGKHVVVGDSGGNVLAADIDTGKVAWTRKVANSHTRGGLSSDGKDIYGICREGIAYRLTPEGKVVWSRLISSDSQLDAYPAPTVKDGVVYVAFAAGMSIPGPRLIALDAKSGKELWKASDPNRVAGRHLNLRSSPALAGEFLLIGQPYGNQLLLVSQKTGRAAGAIDLGQAMFPHWPSPVVAGDVAYLPRHDGALYAVDWKNRKLLWSLYIGDVEQIGQALPANLMPEGWEHSAWKPAVGDALYATPALGPDGTVLIGSGQGWFYAIGGAEDHKVPD